MGMIAFVAAAGWLAFLLIGRLRFPSLPKAIVATVGLGLLGTALSKLVPALLGADSIGYDLASLPSAVLACVALLLLTAPVHGRNGLPA